MDDSKNGLPKFVPISALRPVIDEETEAMFRPDDPVHAAAEQQCKKGDDSALLPVQELIAKGVQAENLRGCLKYATMARCVPLIKGLLALGIPFDSWTAIDAIKTKEPEILSLFYANGWAIHESVGLGWPSYFL